MTPNFETFMNWDAFESRAAGGGAAQAAVRRASEAAEAAALEQDVRDMAALPTNQGPRYRAEAPATYAVRWQGIPSQPGKPKPENYVARVQAGAEGPLKDIIDAGPVGSGTYFPPMFRVAAK